MVCGACRQRAIGCRCSSLSLVCPLTNCSSVPPPRPLASASHTMTTSFLPSPALLTSLTALGRHAGSVPSLAVLADGGGLELDTCVPLELARAREHAASMLPRVATEATRARMVESLSLPADDPRGLLYALSCGCTEGAPGEAASLRLHNELVAKLETTRGEYSARSEMEAYASDLKVAIRTDIARLLSAVQNLETSQAALEVAKVDPAYRKEAAQWDSVHSVWQAVQEAMNAAEGLRPVAPADAQRVAAASRLTAAIQAASLKMEAPADLAVPAAAPQSDAAAAFDVQLLASMATLLQTQLQSLAEWNSRNTELSASIAAAQKVAPRIASFAAAKAEAQAAGAAVSELDRPLKSVRTATTILSKLSGITLIQQMDVEHTDEQSGGMPCMATQMLVAVRGQPAAVGANDEEMYASEANFARIIAAQQANEPDYIVLQVLMLTPSQITEVEALRAGPATVASIAPVLATTASDLASSRVLRVDVLGSLRACQLPSLVDGAQGQRSPEEVQRALETTLIPCNDANAAGVSRATRRALEQQRKYGRGALDSLMRDIAFGQ